MSFKSSGFSFKRAAAVLAVGFSATLSAPSFAAPSWNAWSVGSAAPIVNGSSVEFVVAQEQTAPWSSGQFGSKDFYSTSKVNGWSMSALAGKTLSYEITALNGAAYTGTTGLEGPYVNIVVTDGLGGFSYLLMDATAAPAGQQFHDFSTAQYRFNESLGSISGFTDGTWYNFTQVAGLTIASAGMSSNTNAVTPAGGSWSGYGLTDSFLLVSGNRGSTPTADITIKDVNLTVPEPGSMALLGLGLAGLAFNRRRKVAA